MILIRSEPSSVAIRPGSFASLMDLYERNYIGLRRLIPTLPSQPKGLVSTVPAGLDLHLRVLEQHRYTTEVALTYFFPRDHLYIAEPNLRIRIYRDARVAEVISAQWRSWPAFQADDESTLHRRWRVNRLLFKWLSYCLHQGHHFE